MGAVLLRGCYVRMACLCCSIMQAIYSRLGGLRNDMHTLLCWLKLVNKRTSLPFGLRCPALAEEGRS